MWGGGEGGHCFRGGTSPLSQGSQAAGLGARCGLPPPQALSLPLIWIFRTRFSAPAVYTATVAAPTVAAAPGTRTETLSLLPGRGHSFTRRLRAPWPWGQNSSSGLSSVRRFRQTWIRTAFKIGGFWRFGHRQLLTKFDPLRASSAWASLDSAWISSPPCILKVCNYARNSDKLLLFSSPLADMGEI
jgi:hypothetical protein